MSVVEEDIELRDLLAQTLERNGCLAKLRAELRASIFLALDEDLKLSKQQPLQNLRVQSYLETPEGRAMFCLVREFLEFFNLQFTISVYEPETYFDSIGQYEGRQKVAKDLGLDNIAEPTVPLLQQLLKIAQSNSKVLDINLNLNGNINGSLKDDSSNIDSSYNRKTESCNGISISSNNELQLSQEKSNKIEYLINGNVNTTFDLNSPTVSNGHHEDGMTKHSKREEDCLEKSNVTSDESANISKILANSNFKLDESNKSRNLSNEKINFNETYDLNSPTVNVPSQIVQSKNVNYSSLIATKLLKDIKEDDTYEDTSSIAEDSEALEKPEDIENEVPIRSPSSSSTSENAVELSSRISSLTKPDIEKSKFSLQRPKGSLSSPSDISPLSLNKTRVSSDILPSLYSKDFKNNSNLKELDKMFDMEAEYEEDFMYSNELSLNSPPIKSSQSKSSTVEESIANKTDSDMLNIIDKKDPKSLTNQRKARVNLDTAKSLLKPIQTNCSNLIITGDHCNGSISEHNTSEA